MQTVVRVRCKQLTAGSRSVLLKANFDDTNFNFCCKSFLKVHQPYQLQRTKFVISKITANFAVLLTACRKYLISQLGESIMRSFEQKLLQIFRI